MEEEIKGLEEIKRYMVLENNVVIAYYSNEISDNIPKDAIEISQNLYEELLKFSQPRLKNNKTADFDIDDFEENIIEVSADEIKQMRCQQAQKYLKDTDYVVIKMMEYSITNQKIDNDYSDILQERERCREIIRKNEGGD